MSAPDVIRRDEAVLDAMKAIAKLFGRADEFYLFREYLDHMRDRQENTSTDRYAEDEFRREAPYWIKEIVLPLGQLYDMGYADGAKTTAVNDKKT